MQKYCYFFAEKNVRSFCNPHGKSKKRETVSCVLYCGKSLVFTKGHFVLSLTLGSTVLKIPALAAGDNYIKNAIARNKLFVSWSQLHFMTQVRNHCKMQFETIKRTVHLPELTAFNTDFKLFISVSDIC